MKKNLILIYIIIIIFLSFSCELGLQNKEPYFIIISIDGSSESVKVGRTLTLIADAIDLNGPSDIDRIQWTVENNCGEIFPDITDLNESTTFTGNIETEECIVTATVYDKSNASKSDSITIEIKQVLELKYMVLVTVNNNETINITLKGDGFESGTTIKLSKLEQPDIFATNINVESIDLLTCSFELNEAPIGFWDIVVTNPDSKYSTQIEKVKIYSSASSSFLSSLDWVDIPGELFKWAMSGDGYSTELPVHTVTLTDFRMMAKEVTFSQYDECVAAMACEESSYTGSYLFDKPNNPVLGITWNNAQEFCHWVGGELPTEAQWEYSAGGGSQHWKWSLDENSFTEGKYCFDTSPTCEVASYEPNSFGLYDMSGNVWEYCLDKYQNDFYSESDGAINPICDKNSSYGKTMPPLILPPIPPPPPTTGPMMIVRGGSYKCDNTRELRTNNRNVRWLVEYSYNCGFRCASLPQE